MSLNVLIWQHKIALVTSRDIIAYTGCGQLQFQKLDLWYASSIASFFVCNNFCMDQYRVISSAKREIVLPGEIWSTTSLMKIKNNRGPKTDPCGTPEMTGKEGDWSPAMTTTCELHVKYLWIHCTICGSTSISTSHCSKMLWETLSMLFWGQRRWSRLHFPIQVAAAIHE